MAYYYNTEFHQVAFQQLKIMNINKILLLLMLFFFFFFFFSIFKEVNIINNDY